MEFSCYAVLIAIVVIFPIVSVAKAIFNWWAEQDSKNLTETTSAQNNRDSNTSHSQITRVRPGISRSQSTTSSTSSNTLRFAPTIQPNFTSSDILRNNQAINSSRFGSQLSGVITTRPMLYLS